jgi:GTP-binding protein EngB required for normal cell division
MRRVDEMIPREVAPDGTVLRDYGRLKHQIVDAIRQLQRLLEQHGDSQGASDCHDLMVRLAEDRFTLAVIGQFKRGKSTLMNAVIGRDLLPTGVLPLTSAITVLKYGPAEKLVVRHEGRGLPMEEPASRLADYVTQKGNPGNRRRVKTACLEVPVPFLRRGLEFVDTPGVGSAIEANTATTYGFLPQCDAVVFVTSVDTPVTQAEVALLAGIRQQVRRIFYVVNKTDLLGRTELDEVLGFIADALGRKNAAARVRLFPVSSRLALHAKRTNDPLGYAASGLKELEEALAEFLVQDKTSTFLVSVIDRAMCLVPGGADGTAVSPASTENPAANLAGRFDTIRQSLLDGQVQPRERAVTDTPSDVPDAQEERPQPADVPLPVAIAKDLQTRGCPMCHHLGETALRFFAHWQFALASDEVAQRQFVAESGFCPLHTWQLASVSSPQGLSLGFPKLVERLADRLGHLATAPETAMRALQVLVPGPRECRVCQLLRQAEQPYVPQLLAFLEHEAGRQAYSRSQGLCLRHLGLLTAAAPRDLGEFLVTHAMRRFEEMAEDMRAYALKRDAIRRELSNRNEEDAHLLAIIHIVGESRMCMPWWYDGEA